MGKFLGAGNTIQYTPSGADVAAGAIIVIEDKVCVAKNNIADGKVGELDTNGQFKMTKTAATTYTKGKKAYWDTVLENVVEASGGNTIALGYIIADALSADAEVAVYLANNA